jgi:DNA-binding PadR family transcriptional regulator
VLIVTASMALLAILDQGPTHGFDLKRRFDALLGHDRELKYGQVYSTLARLERDGLAAGIGLQAGAGNDRKLYAITPAGITELDHWLSTPSPVTAQRTDVFARVVLALASGRSTDDVLDIHRRAYLDRMRVLTAVRGEADTVGRLAADFEIAHLEANLQWIELAAGRLASSSPDTRPPTAGPASSAPPAPQPTRATPVSRTEPAGHRGPAAPTSPR